MTTTLIRKQVIPLQNETYQVRFIYPEDKKTKDPEWVRSPSEFDIERQLDFRQKRYILEKLNSWINQRERARPDAHQIITNCRYCLGELKIRRPDDLYRYVHNKRADFEHLAPVKETSKWLPYYQKTIVPILDFCTNKQLNP